MSSTVADGEDGSDENNIIYRHPDRELCRFTMTQDVYALGVVLLEIGLWTPLSVKDLFSSSTTGSAGKKKQQQQHRHAQGYEQGQHGEQAGGAAQERPQTTPDVIPVSDPPHAAEAIRHRLKEKSRNLAIVMGQRYQRVVEKCLDAGFEDHTPIAIPGSTTSDARYVREVFDELAEMSVGMV